MAESGTDYDSAPVKLNRVPQKRDMIAPSFSVDVVSFLAIFIRFFYVEVQKVLTYSLCPLFLNAIITAVQFIAFSHIFSSFSNLNKPYSTAVKLSREKSKAHTVPSVCTLQESAGCGPRKVL